MLSLSTLLYDLFHTCYKASIHIAAPFRNKARQWVDGRKHVFEILETRLKDKPSKRLWMHCASLGEFEQGRPVLEAFKKSHPEYCIVLTFFSPSGYELRKNYAGADIISYLPADSSVNARRFIQNVKPQMALFVKYEFWFHYLHTLHTHRIPIVLFSAIFRKEQVFFQWYGLLFRKMLGYFDKVIVQTPASRELLQSINIPAEVAADTRFDRVYAIAQLPDTDNKLTEFKGESPLCIGGSTWPEDELILAEVYHTFLEPNHYKLVIAPHDVSAKNIERLQSVFKGKCRLLSDAAFGDANVLIVDSIGRLASIYRYATFVYIGGAFGKGLHNILEASVYGKPVFFGPRHQKFNEAIELTQAGAAFSINSAEQLNHLFIAISGDADKYEAICKTAKQYVEKKLGGTWQVMAAIERLLPA